MKLPFKFLVVEVIFTLVATFLYFVAFITILAGFSWCGGVHTCDARLAAGVGINQSSSYDSIRLSNIITRIDQMTMMTCDTYICLYIAN